MNTISNKPTNVSRPAPPRQAPEKFDLTSIDTPVEAFLMPTVDLVAGLALGQLGGDDHSRTASLKLEAGGQTLEYSNRVTEAGMQIDGKMNGGDFVLQAQPGDDGASVVVSGKTPGGDFEDRLSPVPGGFQLAGKVGTVDFEESFSLDPMAGFSGHVGELSGRFGSDALTLSLQQEGEVLRATGKLGERKIEERITQGENGCILIEGTIGTLEFKQTLSAS